MSHLKVTLLFILIFCAIGSINSQEGSCGKSFVGQGNIIGGEEILPNEYPWHVALYHIRKKIYLCGGTLISSNTILTAAHCLQAKDYEINVRDLKVFLGVHNLDDAEEFGRTVRPVEEIKVHPDWNSETKKFDADIAILKLVDPIAFSRYIQPICLSFHPNLYEYKDGIVIGYGISSIDAIKPENTPRRLRAPIQSNDFCFTTYPDLGRIASLRTFCGGSGRGVGVCRGDSGGGFYVNVNGIFYLRGIVSSSLFTPGSACDVDKFSLFTDIKFYEKWIATGQLDPKPQGEVFVAEKSTQIIQEPNCGRAKVGVGNIVHGWDVARGEYPWTVVLIYNGTKFLCSGTLISEWKVLTVASCIQGKHQDTPLPPQDIKALIGVYDLDDKFESGRVAVDIKSIHMHPDWLEIVKSYDADIAVLILAEKVQFTAYIQPICLINPNSNIGSVKKGVVVGYGVIKADSYDHENKPKMMTAPIHNDEYCLRKYPHLSELSSGRTFCAGHENGTGICFGDNGAGLMAAYGGTYYLRGMASTVAFVDSHTCDADAYGIYANMLRFYDWVNSIN